MIKGTEALLPWYDAHARVLPWRVPNQETRRPDPYHVWISEIMLQQTRVEAVKGYYERFLYRLPDVKALAEVDVDELMKLWQGLGYYNRARNLQKAAQRIQSDYAGCFPEEYEQIITLPGIGEYTAGAIASIAFGKPVPAVDGNVFRIYTRLLADDRDITKAAFKKEMREDLLAVIPLERAGAWNQAWMDLGATICIPNGEPLCDQCPMQSVCLACQKGTQLNFPVKPAKKARRQEERTVLLLEYQGRYLLQKRPEKGLLAGLWEFPCQEGRLSLEQMRDLLQEWQVPADQIELLGKGKHIFTHVEWHMLGYCIHLQKRPLILQNPETVWATPEEVQNTYSIPSAYQSYLHYTSRT